MGDKPVVATHRKVGRLVSSQKAPAVTTLEENEYSEPITVHEPYRELTSKDVQEYIRFEVWKLASRAKFLGLTNDEIEAVFRPKFTFTEEAVQLAQEYLTWFNETCKAEYMQTHYSSFKERMVEIRERQKPLLGLIGDTWFNQMNLLDIAEEIVRCQTAKTN